MNEENDKTSMNDYEILFKQRELQLKDIEIKLKEKALNKKEYWINSKSTIVVSLFGLIITGALNFNQLKQQKEIEKQKLEYSIYQSALETNNIKLAAKLLDFYTEANIIPKQKRKFYQIALSADSLLIPVYHSFGKYSATNDPTIPKGATNDPDCKDCN